MELTVRENLSIYGRYFDLPRAGHPAARRRAPRLRPADRARRRPGRAAVGRHEAAPDDRPQPDQRAGPAPPRRADDGPRPAGPPPALGPPLPPQAAGRHARPDDPLHGRGRAALRPPRGDGQGARSWPRARPRQLIEQHSTREVLELRFPVGVQETLDGQLDGLGERVERLPDRVLVYADDGDAAATRRPRARAAPGDGPRPALLARGRLPPAHRPEPGRLSGRRRVAAPAVRVLRARAARLPPRPGGAAIFSSFLIPVLFLAAMGLGLGSLVDARRPERGGGATGRRWPASPTSPSWRPGSWRPRRCRRRPASRPSRSWPGSSGSKSFHAMIATPIGPADVVVGKLTYIGLRLPARGRRLLRRHGPLRRRRPAPGRSSRSRPRS